MSGFISSRFCLARTRSRPSHTILTIFRVLNYMKFDNISDLVTAFSTLQTKYFTDLETTQKLLTITLQYHLAMLTFTFLSHNTDTDPQVSLLSYQPYREWHSRVWKELVWSDYFIDKHYKKTCQCAGKACIHFV